MRHRTGYPPPSPPLVGCLLAIMLMLGGALIFVSGGIYPTLIYATIVVGVMAWLVSG